jgi:hypothetical protein
MGDLLTCWHIKSPKSSGLELTKEQDTIIYNKDENILVNGVPGCGKTTTLSLRLSHKLKNNKKKYNIILLTKVSNVTEELVNKISKYLPKIKFQHKNRSSRVTAEYNGNYIEISNADAFIDSQIRTYLKDNDMKEIIYVDDETKERKQLNERQVKALWGNHSKKKRIFNELVKGNRLNFKLKNGKPINKIILDEVQDFSQTEAIIYLLTTSNNEISFEGYGDILQSIWYSLENDYFTSPHPNNAINIFKKMKNIKCYPLSICFRCPFYHCKFLKIINEEPNKEYNRKEIQSFFPEPKENENMNKPVFFLHGGINNNIESKNTAEIILNIILTIMANDNDIGYGDIVVLSKKINNNAVFQKLDVLLKEHNIDSIFYETKCGDENKTIDMSKLKEYKCSKCNKEFNKKSYKCKNCGELRKRNKIALISGHGFKGGEAKLVIVFGQSELSIPTRNHPGTPNELNDRSQINVLNSRSLKYLFIGSNTMPSRYISNNIKKLSNVMYFVQDFPEYLQKQLKSNMSANDTVILEKIKKIEEYYDKKNIKDIKKLKMRKKKNNVNDIEMLDFLKNIAINELQMPEIYKKISKKIRELNNNKGKNDYNLPLHFLLVDKIKTILNTPDRNRLTVTDITDKSDSYKYLNEIIEECIKIEEKTFGNPINITYHVANSILGHIPNIVISLSGEKDNFYSCLDYIINNDKKVIYVPENNSSLIFDILKDELSYKDFLRGINRETVWNIIEQDKYRNKDGNLKKQFDEISKHIVDIFNWKNDKEKCILLPNYFKGLFRDMKLENNKKIWNMCLLYDYLFSNIYIQASYKINNDKEFFTGELSDVIGNITSIMNEMKDIKTEYPCKKIDHLEKNEKVLKDELLFDKKKHSDIFHSGYPCSIEGRIDGYNDINILFEFKMSTYTEKCKNSWLLQMILYSYLGIEKQIGESYYTQYFEMSKLYNFIPGKKYVIYFDLNAFHKKYKKKIFNEILNKFGFKPNLNKNFMKKIMDRVKEPIL